MLLVVTQHLNLQQLFFLQVLLLILGEVLGLNLVPIFSNRSWYEAGLIL